MFRQESGVAVVLEERVFRNPSCNGAPVKKFAQFLLSRHHR